MERNRALSKTMRQEEITPGIIRYELDSREEWLHARKGIGGSDAACLLGLSPYKTNVQLWREKKRQEGPEDISKKDYVQYGIAAEPLLRELFALDHPQYTVKYWENNLIKSKKCPWGHASLDGELEDKGGRKGILEIKTTEIFLASQWDKWNDQIPDNYYIQILHYLLITNFDFAVLKAQIKTKREGVKLTTRHYHIERCDVEEDIEILRQAEEDFWHSLQGEKEPDLILPEI